MDIWAITAMTWDMETCFSDFFLGRHNRVSLSVDQMAC